MVLSVLRRSSHLLLLWSYKGTQYNSTSLAASPLLGRSFGDLVDDWVLNQYLLNKIKFMLWINKHIHWNTAYICNTIIDQSIIFIFWFMLNGWWNIAKNAIKKNNKKPDCWAPFLPQWFWTIPRSPCKHHHCILCPAKCDRCFQPQRCVTRVFFVGSWAPFWCAGLDVYYPGAQGSGIRSCCRKLGPNLWNSIKVLKALAGFFFPQFWETKSTRISKTHLFALEVFC